jgi:hypothetical protein
MPDINGSCGSVAGKCLAVITERHGLVPNKGVVANIGVTFR